MIYVSILGAKCLVFEELMGFPFIAAGKKLAMSYGAKFIETSVGIQHNVDELLVGILKQIRLHQTMDRKRKASKPTSSPLHTLQVARDILSRVCINAKQASFTKSCENLHVL